MTPILITVESHEHGERLDRVLSARDLGFSRSVLQRWFRDGRVLVNGAPAFVKTHAQAGMVVQIRPAPAVVPSTEPEAIPLEILYEDEYLLVVNKAAGMVVHPAPGHASGTLVNALMHHISITQVGDPQRPGIVHRLDKDTSGVMVVAKTAHAHEQLVRLFQAHDLERVYHAIVLGQPQAMRIETLYGRHPVDRKRFSSKVTRGKTAITEVKVIERLHASALVTCTLHTGRTHQIRVHMSDKGYPVLADPVYARNPKDPKLKHAAQLLSRQALHASVLGFVHPITQQALHFEVPRPDDFALALASLQ